jgi:hypothetical protein
LYFVFFSFAVLTLRSVQRGYAESAAYLMGVLKNNSICEVSFFSFLCWDV